MGIPKSRLLLGLDFFEDLTRPSKLLPPNFRGMEKDGGIKGKDLQRGRMGERERGERIEREIPVQYDCVSRDI